MDVQPGIDPAKLAPGALLQTEPTPGRAARLVETVDWDPAVGVLTVHEESAVGPVRRTMTAYEVRQATLLRPAPNLIDDYLAGGYEEPPELVALFARCDEILEQARITRHAKRQPGGAQIVIAA